MPATRSANELIAVVRAMVAGKSFAKLEELVLSLDADALTDLDGSGAMLTRNLMNASRESPPPLALAILGLALSIVPRVPRINPDMAQEIRTLMAARHEAAGRPDLADALYLAPRDGAADDIRHWSHFVIRRADCLWFEGHQARAVALFEAALARVELAGVPSPDVGIANFAPWERLIEFRWGTGDVPAIVSLVKRMQAFRVGLSAVDKSAPLSMAVWLAMGDPDRARGVLESAIRGNSGYLCVNHANELLRLAGRFNSGAGGPIPDRVRAFAAEPLEREFESRFHDEPVRALWATGYWNKVFGPTATAAERAAWDERRRRVIASAPQKIARNEGWCPRCLSEDVEFTGPPPPPHEHHGECCLIIGRPKRCRTCEHTFDA